MDNSYRREIHRHWTIDGQMVHSLNTKALKMRECLNLLYLSAHFRSCSFTRQISIFFFFHLPLIFKFLSMTREESPHKMIRPLSESVLPNKVGEDQSSQFLSFNLPLDSIWTALIYTPEMSPPRPVSLKHSTYLWSY